MEEIKSKPSFGFLTTRLIFTALLTYAFAGFFIDALEAKYYDIYLGLISIAFFSFALKNLLHLFLHKRILAEDDQLSITILLWTKHIPPSQLNSRMEVNESLSHNFEYHKLYFDTKNKEKYVITSLDYDNYDEIRNFISRNTDKVTDKRFFFLEYLRSFPFVIFGLALSMLLIFGGIQRLRNNITLPKKELTEFEVHFSDPPFVDISVEKEKAKLVVAELPEFDFMIYDESFHELRNKGIFHNNPLASKKVYLVISKEEFDSKIESTRDPNFLTKHMGWRTIQVWQILHNGEKLIHLENSIKKTRNDDIGGLILIGIGVLIMIGAILAPFMEKK